MTSSPAISISVDQGSTHIKLSGSRPFVEEYLEFLRACGSVPGEVAVVQETSEAEPESKVDSIDAFLDSLGISPQTTVVQDLIVIFGYYVTRVQRRPSFTLHDLEFHFALAGVRPPKNLANALGVLKRKRGFIDSGDRRGTQILTPAGIRFVQGLRKSERSS